MRVAIVTVAVALLAVTLQLYRPKFVTLDCTRLLGSSVVVSPLLSHVSADRRLFFIVCGRIYCPRPVRSLQAVSIALLLLLGGIESNPGPPVSSPSAAVVVPVLRLPAVRLGVINARSACNKIALIHDVIDSHHIDVLVITETWMTAEQPAAILNDVAPANYTVTHQFREAGWGGGVAVVHRRELQMASLSLTSTAGSFQCLALKLITKHRRVNIAAIYRPPSSSSYGAALGQFCAEFAEYLDEFLLLPGDAVICGDFNCPGGDAVSINHQLIDVLTGRQLVQHVEEPTHDAGNLLDLLISVDGSHVIQNVSVVDVGISDHSLVSADIAVHRTRPPSRSVVYRNIKIVDPVRFAEVLRTKEVCTSPIDEVNRFAAQLDQSVTQTLDELAPLKTRTVRCGKRSSRWLSEQAIETKRVRRRLERRWKKTGKDSDRQCYRAACRRANTEINRSREMFYQNRLDSAAGDQRAQWRVVRELLHNDGSHEDVEPAHARRLCRQLAQFFADKLSRIAHEIEQRLESTSGLSCTVRRQMSRTSMNFFTVVTVEEVVRLIRSLPPKTSPLDCMPVSLLKSSVDVMAPLIARLGNLSFTEGIFPDRYKVGRVIPLPKKPGKDKNDLSNYRPITNLSTFSKLLEKLALARLQPVVLGSGNFPLYQSAYRKDHSTETALLRIVNDIRRASGAGKCTALLGLDISAAFDAVDHGILVSRAAAEFGIGGQASSWLQSFLVDRWQYIVVGSEQSPSTRCLSGVPQGSVLGPLLFAMYVSPVADVVAQHGIQYHQYADDLQLYTAIHAADQADLTQVSRCVSDVARWFNENHLLLNATKTEAVVFGTSRRLQRVDLSCGVDVAGVNVQFADAVRLLGVTLDSSLSFDRHVIDVVKSCNFHIRALKVIRPRLTLEAAKSVAASIVSTRLDYCNSVLHGTTECNLDKLQRVQNSLARVVCQATWSSSATALRRSLHWLPIRQRIIFKTGLLTYKILSRNQPVYLINVLQQYQPARTLRSAAHHLLCIPSVTSNFESRAFSATAPATWNSLSLYTRTAPSVDCFKTRLKTELFAAAYD